MEELRRGGHRSTSIIWQPGPTESITGQDRLRRDSVPLLTEIKAEIPTEAVERTDAALLEIGDGRWSLLEDAVTGRAWIVGIFTDEAAALSEWAGLKPTLPALAPGRPSMRTLHKRDWAESYKEHFHAWHFGRLHWVPAWERGMYRAPDGHAVLWLDPGMAFGTGNHETTRLCAERLVALSEGDFDIPTEAVSVLDAGCGSGILALSAALLGFGTIKGFDIDPEAVRVSRDNAALNGLDGRVSFSVGDLASSLTPGRAGVVLANIQADILLANARELTRAVAPGGRLVLSGILLAERESVLAAFGRIAPGWAVDSQVLGEWSDLVLGRPN